MLDGVETEQPVPANGRITTESKIKCYPSNMPPKIMMMANSRRRRRSNELNYNNGGCCLGGWVVAGWVVAIMIRMPVASNPTQTLE